MYSCFQNYIHLIIFQGEGEFAWDEATQGVILGSFFYGYVLTQVGVILIFYFDSHQILNKDQFYIKVIKCV